MCSILLKMACTSFVKKNILTLLFVIAVTAFFSYLLYISREEKQLVLQPKGVCKAETKTIKEIGNGFYQVYVCKDAEMVDKLDVDFFDFLNGPFVNKAYAEATYRPEILVSFVSEYGLWVTYQQPPVNPNNLYIASICGVAVSSLVLIILSIMMFCSCARERRNDNSVQFV